MIVVTEVVDVVGCVVAVVLVGFEWLAVWNGVEGVGIEVEFSVVVAVVDRPCNGCSQHNMQLGSLTMCPDLFRSVAIV